MRSLMLVSAAAGTEFRQDVQARIRPRPEFLQLEQCHGVELLDWSGIGLDAGNRSLARSARHVNAALRRLDDFDIVFSDGEHVGIPLALAMSVRRASTRQLMIAHNLLTPLKTRILRYSGVGSRVDRVLIHSANQLPRITSGTRLPGRKLAVVPYGIDSSFWRQTDDLEDERLVVSAGREHRDYRSLVASLPSWTRVVIADHSPFTPHATRLDPDRWPPNIERVALDPLGLRSLYSQAAVVVVPVIDSPMPAGITTLLEAMAMGKAVVVTETPALRGVVQDGLTGITVRPGDVNGLRAAIRYLLASPGARHSLGARARTVAVELYDVGVYAGELARHLAEVATAAN
jgi:glycosyltransferase involved in cell wall biosynthesis